MAARILKVFLASLLVASGARVRVQEDLATSSLPADWAEKTPYVCMQKWKDSSKSFENKFCLVKYMEGLRGETVQYAVDIDACAKGETMKVCEMKGEGNDLRLSYTSKKPVAKACFRAKISRTQYALIEAAVDASTCEGTKGGDIGEALVPTTTTKSTTTTTEEVPPEPELDEEAEKAKIVDALSLFAEEGYWELNGKNIKCCVSSKGKPTQMQDLNAEELPSVRMAGHVLGCGRMFGDTYHNGLKPFKDRTEPTCAASVAEIMEVSGLELADVLALKLPEVVAPVDDTEVDATEE